MQADDEWPNQTPSHTSYTSSSEGASEGGKYYGFYQKVLNKKREAENAIFDDSKDIDLDAELQKLEKIKELRRSKLEEHRDRINKAKLDVMTQVYMQNEYAQLKNQQYHSKDSSVYYSQDFKTVKEIPQHRLLYRNQQEAKETDESGVATAEVKEREVMMAPNNLDFFYAAEETSDRIWRIDERLNKIYVWLVRVMMFSFVVGISLHLKSRRDMTSAARIVSLRIEKEGPKATLNADGEVVVFMDGKVQ